MSVTDGMVKVGLRAPDGAFETLWATPVGEHRYRLEDSPFFAYRVSWLDVVEAHPDADGLPTCERVVVKSGHRTVRLIISPGIDEAPDRQQVLDELVALGCSYEGYNPRYFSVDVPAVVELAVVARLLTDRGEQWEYADPTFEDLFPGESVESSAPAS